jgi:hypothetical protein
VTGGERVPRRKSEPSHKCTAIDLERKTGMLCKYEDGQSLSAIAPELGFVVLTIVKDAARIKERVTGKVLMNLILAKKRGGAISEMEKLLRMSMEV